MDLVLKETIKRMNKNGKVEISQKLKDIIYQNFPIPIEQKILCVQFQDNLKNGVVITDKGIFKKTKDTYNYIKWGFFDIDDYEKNKDKSAFLDIYTDVYKGIIKEATVSAENIFANLEAVIPENYAKANSKTRSRHHGRRSPYINR